MFTLQQVERARDGCTRVKTGESSNKLQEPGQAQSHEPEAARPLRLISAPGCLSVILPVICHCNEEIP
eukprot:2397440-Karenia_brevis.AAC.1